MNREDDFRPDPDVLLSEVLREETEAQRGKLSIFLGMCPGVGKTYAMLKAARMRQEEGVDVLVGVVETHGREETANLLEGLRILPRLKLQRRGHALEEFDIDAALRERPGLVLVDELAHSNAPGSRHAKRYQDVLELVRAGIDVFTTLNVQHIESQVDVVRQITGVHIQETVPDSILDHADEIEVIDLSVEKLLDRLAAGKVYLEERAESAALNYFKADNLTALRELALRFTAEHVDRDLEDRRRARRTRTPWKTNARLLVGVGPSPYAESLIRWTRRAAQRLGCPWLAVWAEGAGELSAEEQACLGSSLALARQLGAEVVSAAGDDVVAALLQVARERNVTQIVVGKPGQRDWLRRSLADRLVSESGDIDVCMVRPVTGRVAAVAKQPGRPVSGALIGEYSWVVTISFVLVSIGWGVRLHTGYAFVGLAFLLAVVLVAVRFQRGPVLVLATLLALSWDFFFIEPAFTLQIRQPHDIIMFVMFFIVALSMGHLTTRLREREQTERQRQRRTAALLRVTQSAALSAEPENGLKEALATIGEALDAEVALLVREDDRSLPREAHRASTFTPSPKEWGVVHWTYQNKHVAGRFTDTLPESEATWFPLQTATALMGVLGVRFRDAEMLAFGTRQSVEAFALQLALVLEKEHFVSAIKRAEILAHSEHLQRALLDSVSHELKTPLAVIQASLEGLADIKSPYLDEIHTASRRLQRVVEHLLQMTRIESAAVRPIGEWCVVSELVQQAIQVAGAPLLLHPLRTDIPENLETVRTDPNLFIQALANILHNAAIYTPVDAPIEITCSLSADKRLTVRVADHGPGLREGDEVRIFQKFYRAAGSPTGGTGLGLSIARALMRALGGDITAGNRNGGGSEFVLVVPVDTLPA